MWEQQIKPDCLKWEVINDTLNPLIKNCILILPALKFTTTQVKILVRKYPIFAWNKKKSYLLCWMELQYYKPCFCINITSLKWFIRIFSYFLLEETISSGMEETGKKHGKKRPSEETANPAFPFSLPLALGLLLFDCLAFLLSVVYLVWLEILYGVVQIHV